MNILDRYLGRTVIAGTLLALFILLAVDLFFAFVNEVQELGRGDYGLSDVFAYLGLTVPRRIHEMFPMAALVGSLLSLGALASGSELVAMRAAGVSVLRIAQSVLKAGLIMLVFAAALGEWAAPWAEREAQQRRIQAMSQAITFRSEHGFWARDGQRFINISHVLPDGRLSRVEVYQIGAAGDLEVMIRANLAEPVEGGWRLLQVQRGDIDDRRLKVTRSKTLELPSLLDAELLSVVTIDPDDLSARDLRRYVRYMRDNGLDPERYELAFWRRVTAPLAGLVMLLLSIPFVFGPLRSAGTGQRLVWGVLVGVAFFLLNRTLGTTGQVYGLPPLLSALLPSLLFFAGGLWVMRRVR